MRIRRALAAAAATAAIVPAALLAAPSAHADGQDGSDGTTTTSQRTGTDPAGSAQETDKSSTGTGKDSTGSLDTTRQDDGADKSADDPKNGDEQPPGQKDDTKTGNDDSGTPDTSGTTDTTGGADDTTPADPASDEPECTQADFTASLAGFPNKIAAGSGWQDFTLKLDNSQGEKAQSIDIGATILYQKDADSEYNTLAAKYATMEYFDPGSHEWLNSRGDLGDTSVEPGEFEGNVDVAAGQALTLKMRVRIGKDAPVGGAVAIAAGFYGDDAHTSCRMDVEWYEFDVVPPGHSADGATNATPQGGAVPIDLKPQGHVQHIGALAETGASSSQLTTIGLSGAAAVVLGGGALVVLRRRKAGSRA